MNSISQLMKYRRSMVEYALKHGVTKTAIKYNTYRQYVYRWLRRYDGSLESLRNKSRSPKHHPKAHTAAELKLIQDLTGEAKGKRFYQYTAIDEFSCWRYEDNSKDIIIEIITASPCGRLDGNLQKIHSMISSSTA